MRPEYALDINLSGANPVLNGLRNKYPKEDKMKIHRTNVYIGGLPVSFDTGEGLGEGFAVSLGRTHLIVINRGVAFPFWSLRDGDRTIAKGWLHEECLLEIGGYCLQVSNNNIYIEKAEKAVDPVIEV